jgi:NhaP-type Na+/H+ or K+/H+ antiporter
MLSVFLVSSVSAAGAVWASLQPSQHPIVPSYFTAAAVLLVAVAGAALSSMVIDAWRNPLTGSWGRVPPEEGYDRTVRIQRNRRNLRVHQGGRK